MNRTALSDALTSAMDLVEPIGGEGDGTPRNDYSDLWLESHMWLQLSKLTALEQLLFNSADTVDTMSPEMLRGTCTLFADVHDSIFKAVEKWARMNLLRRSWVPHSATIPLANLQQFTADQVKKAILQNCDDHSIFDVSVRELSEHVENCYHAELPADSDSPGQ